MVDKKIHLQSYKETNQQKIRMHFSKKTSKGRTTIPAFIRKAAHMKAGDTLTFEIKGNHVIVRKINSPDDAYLKGVEEILKEWSSPEDDEAWRTDC